MLHVMNIIILANQFNNGLINIIAHNVARIEKISRRTIENKKKHKVTPMLGFFHF